MTRTFTGQKRVFISSSYRPLDITGEVVTVPAGAAGTIVNFYILKHPIANSSKSYIAGLADTTLVLTSTAFTREVAAFTPDASLVNGDYWVDYLTGLCRGKKADSSTSLTAAYSIFVP